MEMKKLRVVWRSLRTLQLKSPRVRRRRGKKRKKEGGETHFPLYGERILLFRKICKSGSLQICLVVRKELHFLSLLCRILCVFLRLPPLHLLLQLLLSPHPPQFQQLHSSPCIMEDSPRRICGGLFPSATLAPAAAAAVP